jgi:alpha-tubulin suppressor-like RCC1 family protein
VQVPGLQHIEAIYCGQSYSYAQDTEGSVFAWGMGDNYVLANGKEMDGNEWVPRKVNPKFFKEETPVLFALGS